MAMDHGTPATLAARLKDIVGPRSRVQRDLLGLRSQTDSSSSSLEWHSFRKPTLEGGTYSISVSQSVKIPGNPTQTIQNEKDKTQTLTVQAPRFTLQPSDIFSVYPPALSTTDLTILPSIVFADPTLPWERVAKYNAADPGPDQGIMPWLALIVFEKDELRPKPASLTSISDDPETGSFKLRLGNLTSCPDISLPILKSPEAITADETAGSVDVIFLSPSTFMPLLYNNYQDDGSLTLPDPSTSTASDVSRYQYFVHTRKAPPDSDGIDAEEHSVIFSHRTANASKKAARTVAVHLVSIEGWDLMKLAADCSKSAVALISLHSWTYTVNPAAPPQFMDMLTPLAGSPPAGDKLRIPNGLQMSDDRMLRNPSATTEKLDTAAGLSPETLIVLKTQLACGYSMHKYRLATGEPTVALYRGPLTPVPVPHDIFATPGKTGVESSFGKDLDIMNQEIGMSDITYSSAWSLGRLLAASNKDFCHALTRIRRSTLNKSLQAATLEGRKTFAASDARPITTAVPQLWSALSKMVGSDTFASTPFAEAALHEERWRVTDRKPGSMVQSGSEMFSDENIDKFKSAIKLHIQNLSSTRQDSSKANAGLQPYNELNKPNSGTYPIVLKQLLEFKFLDTIPVHYLIPLSDFLPPESIRFFYIDKNWIDTFVDGALSIGNTLDVDGTDPIKAEIKESVALYENTPIDYPTGRHKPQTPKYGFCIRSKLISTWPDVRFAAPFPPNFKGGKLEVLGTKRLESDVVMVLLDRCPEDLATEDDIPPDATDDIRNQLSKSIADAKASGGIPLLSSISIIQPPHNQSLVLGRQFDDQIIKINLVDYDITTKVWNRLDEVQFHANDPSKSIYDWKNSLIKVEKLRDLLKTTLPCMKDQTSFKDVGPLLLGLNLSSTIDSLRMDNVGTTKDSNNPAPPLPHVNLSKRMMGQHSLVSRLEQEISQAVPVEAPKGSDLVTVDPAVLAKHQNMANADVAFGTVHLHETAPTAHLQSSFGQHASLDSAADSPSAVSTGPIKLRFSTSQMPLEGLNQIPITSGTARLVNSPPLVDLLIELSIPGGGYDPKTFLATNDSVKSVTLYLPLIDPTSSNSETSGSGFLKSYASSRPRILYKQHFSVDTDLHLTSDVAVVPPYPAVALVISSRWLEESSFPLRELDGALVVLPQIMTAAPCANQDVYVVALIRYGDGTFERSEATTRLVGTAPSQSLKF